MLSASGSVMTSPSRKDQLAAPAHPNDATRRARVVPLGKNPVDVFDHGGIERRGAAGGGKGVRWVVRLILGVGLSSRFVWAEGTIQSCTCAASNA